MMRVGGCLRILAFLLGIIHSESECRAQSDTINQRAHGARVGYWVKHRWNGQLKWEGRYLNGERTGHWKFHDKSGIHHSEGELINGYRKGPWYLVHTPSGTKLDMTRWDGKGHCVGGATLSW